MSSVTAIERALERLSPDELNVFRQWFLQRESDEWDKQIEADVEAGRLDVFAEEALTELREGRCTDL